MNAAEHGVTRAVAVGGLLGVFNRSGVLDAADVRIATALTGLAGLDPADPATEPVSLAAALAVRAPRLGHVYVDLATIATTATADTADPGGAPDDAADPSGPVPLAELPWPDPDAWVAAVAACTALVRSGEGDVGPLVPLRVLGSRLFLERYLRQERTLAERLIELDRQPAATTDLPLLADRIAALFPAPADPGQRAAAATVAVRGLSVIAGGPGTGKTTTVARSVALLLELAAGQGHPAPLIALCAPTGKAAARLTEAIRRETAGLSLSPAAAAGLENLTAATIHRLLGVRGPGGFRHDRSHPLPHDVVIVDETSMVSLSLLAHLLDAVRADARLVLVGDPDQLSAIEAGAVLRDIVGPAAAGPVVDPAMAAILTRVTADPPAAAKVTADPPVTARVTADPPATATATATATADGGFGSGVVVLSHSHRFAAPVAALAAAIRRGDVAAAIGALSAEATPITWLNLDAAELGSHPEAEAVVRDAVLAAFGALVRAARSGEATAALTALGEMRILCAHRHGPYGVTGWTARSERWLADALGGSPEPNYPGRPLLVTENDYELGLFNGDSGVILTTETDGPTAVFAAVSGPVSVAPTRLGPVQTAYASTIHKSQGSEFPTVLVILPDPDARLLSRELLYTAVTRAQRKLLILGGEAALRAAIERPVQRATGLAARLWTPSAAVRGMDPSP